MHFANGDNRFGTIATLLELVPVASIFFSFTNQGKPLHKYALDSDSDLHIVVGAALWAADIERQNSASTTAPGLRETAKKAD